jgi:hypothetical protein
MAVQNLLFDSLLDHSYKRCSGSGSIGFWAPRIRIRAKISRIRHTSYMSRTQEKSVRLAAMGKKVSLPELGVLVCTCNCLVDISRLKGTVSRDGG